MESGDGMNCAFLIMLMVEGLKWEYDMRNWGRRPSRKGWIEGRLVEQWERGRRPSRSSVSKSLHFRNIINRIWRIHISYIKSNSFPF